MTILMRDELNDADLAWAAADASISSAMEQLLRARDAMAQEAGPTAGRPARDRSPVEPAVLRAHGAL